ncbi:hypothetical protein M404DRAFT_754731 [Pisolithus tinctorius Marx 270]|uniref:Uncharacterized protein n=1 Tax=Pisolithus tinctorius Marx 270 TaxID=870435 RepID=A0A0C3IUP7_PISTI|nr:hypothetical protein M404DRAFT_754731 [Pisolithus tinctorius Marx 270]
MHSCNAFAMAQHPRTRSRLDQIPSLTMTSYRSEQDMPSRHPGTCQPPMCPHKCKTLMFIDP